MDDKRKDHSDPAPPPKKEIAPNNYRPITCLRIMWKVLTTQIKEIYDSLISDGLFPRNRKDAAREPEEQENYYTLINTFSKTAK